MNDERNSSVPKKHRRRKRVDRSGRRLTSILRLPIDLTRARERVILGSLDVVEILRPALGHPLQEVIVSVALDARGRILGALIVSVGTLTASLAHPREIFRDAIKRCAATIILVHTHPSGSPEPSEDDRHLTKRVVEAGVVVGIPVRDHIVIGKDQHWSFADHQCLSTGRFAWTRR
jgi:DNA repair protein RadC